MLILASVHGLPQEGFKGTAIETEDIKAIFVSINSHIGVISLTNSICKHAWVTFKSPMLGSFS